MSHIEAEKLEELAKSGGSDAHLDGCAECRASLKAATGRVRMLKALHPYTLGDVAFSRVEARLMEEVAKPRGFNWVRLGLGFALAASVAAVAWTLAPKAPAPSPIVERQRVIVPKVVEPLKVLSPELTAVRIEGGAKHSGSNKPVVAGELLAADDRVETAGKLTLSGERLILEGKGGLTLGHGLTASVDDSFAAQVEPGDSTALLDCAGTFVGGVDAAFLVTVAGAEVVVEVMRGEVKVSPEAQLADAMTLKAPASAHLRQGRLVGAISRPAESTRLTQLPKRPWSKLDFDFPAGTQLELDGAKVGVAPLSLMWTDGKHKWRAVGPGHAVHEGTLDLISGNPYTVRAPPEIAADVEPDEATIAALNAALKAQTPKLRACYEKWLKANAGAEGEVELNLSLAATGKVVKVAIDPHDTGMSKDALDCLSRNAKALVLPKVGSPQEVALPLILTTHH
jgi:hypothetical protein